MPRNASFRTLHLHHNFSAPMGNRGPPKAGPPSSRRYRARTYNEYMDPMEVASSTISMPPIQTMNRMQNNHPTSRTLPRPMSSEVMLHSYTQLTSTSSTNLLIATWLWIIVCIIDPSFSYLICYIDK